MRVEMAYVAFVATLASTIGSGSTALAHCRITTCPLPVDFSPSPGHCQPSDFPKSCVPLWWRNACQSYDIQKDASRQVPYDVAVQSFATAFSKWTGATCRGGGHPSIRPMDLGPVACNEMRYNTGEANQHTIIFQDRVWPYSSDVNHTLALTTVTFDTGTGEIEDVDMAINSTMPLTVSGPVPPGGIDFMSIITHEVGHFFGMAHSDDEEAAMYACYTPGTESMRHLTADDTTGICSIYRPGGERAVGPGVIDGGIVQEDPCDPTPRYGFQSACTDGPTARLGCAVGAVGAGASVASTGFPSRRSSDGWVALAATAAAASARRARRGARR